MKNNMNFLTKSVHILPKASLQQSLEAVVVKQMLKQVTVHSCFNFAFSFARGWSYRFCEVSFELLFEKLFIMYKDLGFWNNIEAVAYYYI